MLATETITIREAYDIISGHNQRSWVAIDTIRAMTGMRAEELAAEIRRLAETDPYFRAEPEALGSRLTEDDERYAVKIAGEDRHRIAWC